MRLNTPIQTVLYSIEKAIKEYRRFCQMNISQEIDDITVDQALVLILIEKHPGLNQKELAELVFKDNASMTRIIELMVKKQYLDRTINHNDRRTFNLAVTKKGNGALKKLEPVILYNRSKALQGINDDEIKQLYTTLQKIISNCNNADPWT